MEDETRGSRRRSEIVAAAADLSTTEGLDGLSFARLAAEIGLTKAGVAAHFESKEDLQLAVVRAAARDYSAALDGAGRDAAPGLPRLAALADAWLDYLQQTPYRGGCFFAAAGQAFAGRPGPVRNAIAENTALLLRALDEQARLARRLGELHDDVEPNTLVFQIHALALEANLRRQLLDDVDAFDDARRALRVVLDRAASSSREERDA